MNKQSFFIRFLKEGFIAVFITLIASIALITSVCITINYETNYDHTDAKISEIIYDEKQEPISAMVEYRINNNDYTADLHTYYKDYEVGYEVVVYYKPDNPSEVIVDTRNAEYYLYTVGSVLFVVGIAGIILTVSKVHRISRINEHLNQTTFKFSDYPELLDEEVTYYFQYEDKPINDGYFIDDKNKIRLIEIKKLESKFINQYEYEYNDHQKHIVEKHLIGHLEQKEIHMKSFDFPITSTFTFDRKDIWEFINHIGVKIKTVEDRLEIYFHHRFAAQINMSNKHVHENKKEEIQPGYYIIKTKEKELNVIFLVLFALSLTGMGKLEKTI